MSGAETREYALYLRESVGRAAIARQRTLTTAHIEKAGGVIAAEFTDADSTAYRKPRAPRPERKDFDRMIAWLAGNPGKGIAAYHADRLLRDIDDTALLIRACEQGGHLIETYGGGTYDLSTATGRRRLRDDASAAAYEVDHNRERILAQKAEAAGEGRWLGSMRPFGYEGIPAEPGAGRRFDGLRVVPAEAAAIRSAAEEVLEGTSLHSVVARWRAAGIRGTQGGGWTVSNLRRLLINPRYAGIAVHRGRETTAQWPPILPEEVSRALQARLGAQAKPGHSTARKWLGSGLYLCGVCERPVHVRGVSDSSGRDKSYCCPLNHVGRAVSKVDKYVTELVLAYLERPETPAEITAAMSPPVRGEDVTLLRAQVVLVEERKRKLGDMHAAGVIDDQELAGGAARTREELASLSARIAAVGRVSPVLAVAGDPRIREKWPRWDIARRQAVIGGLITVRIMPAGPGRPKGIPWPQGWFDENLIEIKPGPLLGGRKLG